MPILEVSKDGRFQVLFLTTFKSYVTKQKYFLLLGIEIQAAPYGFIRVIGRLRLSSCYGIPLYNISSKSIESFNCEEETKFCVYNL